MSTASTHPFFQERLQPLGVTEENNTVLVRNSQAEWPMEKQYRTKVFSEDREGNIEILYWTLDRELITWTRIGDGKMSEVNGTSDFYKVKRLREPLGDMKYRMPETKWLKAEGQPSIYPWLPPELVERWEKKEEIETLFLTEGVFKAWAGAKAGMDIVGLSSITHYNENGALLRDVQRIILDCKVQNVVILWDGDCTNISENALARREDLAKRPLGFYAAAKKIRKLVGQIEYPSGHEAPAVYFYHIKSEAFPEKPKGLDDLLVVALKESKTRWESVAMSAKEVNLPSNFFKKIDLTDTSQLMKEYFNLHDSVAFYKAHRDIIKASEFKFFDDLIRWNEDDEKIDMIAPKWAQELFWIGNEFFLLADIPSVNGTSRKELSPRNMATLTKLHQSTFWKYLTHFDGFCNVPNHLNYQQVIEKNGKKFYNQYFPFKHVPKAGDWTHIKGFIQHIFGTDEVEHATSGEKIERWKLGLDYVQQLFLNPTQPLPVLILFSPENKTGKSTFGHLLARIFGDNHIPIGNHDLQSDFNATYSSKLLAVCDETLLERKKEAERIKSISTSPRILVNPKGQAQYQIDFFCKFIFTSNNARMIYVNRHDTRFWILQVPQLEKEIPNFLDVMESEIPAFLEHLRTREMAAKNEGRMWFHDSLLKTETLEQTVKINEPSAATDLRNDIIELFQKDIELEEILMPLADIRTRFFSGKTSTGWIQEIMKDYLMVEQLKGTDGLAKMARGEYPTWEHNMEGELVRKNIKFIGRPYVFKRSHFIEHDNMEDYREISETERKELAERMGKNDSDLPPKAITAVVQEDLPF